MEEDGPGLHGRFGLVDACGGGEWALHIAYDARGVDEAAGGADEGCEEDVGDVVGCCEANEGWVAGFYRFAPALVDG